jgi:hypothetical protein
MIRWQHIYVDLCLDRLFPLFSTVDHVCDYCVTKEANPVCTHLTHKMVIIIYTL